MKNRVMYLKTNLWLGVQAGGAIAHTAGVVMGLLRKGYTVNFISAEAPINLPDTESLSINAISPPPTIVVPREINHYQHSVRGMTELSPFLDGFNGLVYQRMSLGNLAGVTLSRKHSVPLVLEYNGSENWLADNWGTPLVFPELANKVEMTCLNNAHLVVTVSDTLKSELIERGIERERIVSVPNGADTDAFDSGRYSKKEISALRAEYGISADSLVVTFVGTFGPWHGADVFARSVVRLATEEPVWLQENKLHFMFIGDGAKRQIVEELFINPEVQRFVTITGLIDQLAAPLHLAASNILVSPNVRNPDGSPFFGSPTKLFEYLASGRPVIGSNLQQLAQVLEGCPHVRDMGGSKELLTSGACGVLVEPENVSELAKAIKFLVENPNWRREAGKNARQRVLERYTWDHHVEAILAGLERVRKLDAAPEVPPIRLLFNGLHSKSGGGLTYLKNILPIVAKDPSVDLHICIHEDQRSLLPDGLDNVTIHAMNFRQGFWRLQFHEQIDVPRLARKIGADVTFSPANYGPILAPNSVLLLRNALSVAFVERRPVKLGYWALVYLATLVSLAFSRRAITVSDYASRAAGGSMAGLFNRQFEVIPHGISDIFLPAEQGRDEYLLVVSDIYVQKNLINLVRAVARLRSTKRDIKLKIAGRAVDPHYFARLQQVVADEDLAANVEFLGEVAPIDLVDLYQRCAVFVFPSTVETFGNPLVEAMACGAPIASSNSAAMPEVVGEAAIYFDPQDVGEMATAIDRLLTDGELRQSISRKAIERSKQYSWVETARKTVEVIRAAASSDRNL